MSTTSSPQRFRLLVEYDGTDFAGFQLQDPRDRTVQGELERAVEKASGRWSRVYVAGRTDAGVHALGQVVHFDSLWQAPLANVPFALNGKLPPDIVVRTAHVCEPDFHARFSATARVYRYVILNRELPSAVLGRYALHLRDPLDVDAMRRGAQHLIGNQDFAAFGKPSQPGQTTVRTITRMDIRKWKGCVLVTVCGNAFLRHMVRAMVGTLSLVGQHKLEPDAVRELQKNGDWKQIPFVAPAKGLFLLRVEYNGTRIPRKTL